MIGWRFEDPILKNIMDDLISGKNAFPGHSDALRAGIPQGEKVIEKESPPHSLELSTAPPPSPEPQENEDDYQFFDPSTVRISGLPPSPEPQEDEGEDDEDDEVFFDALDRSFVSDKFSKHKRIMEGPCEVCFNMGDCMGTCIYCKHCEDASVRAVHRGAAVRRAAAREDAAVRIQAVNRGAEVRRRAELFKWFAKNGRADPEDGVYFEDESLDEKGKREKINRRFIREWIPSMSETLSPPHRGGTSCRSKKRTRKYSRKIEKS